MPTCEPCAVPGHAAGDCANTTKALYAKTCTCRCDRPECDPAPYWTARKTVEETTP